MGVPFPSALGAGGGSIKPACGWAGGGGDGGLSAEVEVGAAATWGAGAGAAAGGGIGGLAAERGLEEKMGMGTGGRKRWTLGGAVTGGPGGGTGRRR